MALVITIKTLAWNGIECASYRIVTVFDPFLWKTAVVLCIVEGL
jgi:hypothetical protein